MYSSSVVCFSQAALDFLSTAFGFKNRPVIRENSDHVEWYD